jgi:hypothetical protein
MRELKWQKRVRQALLDMAERMKELERRGQEHDARFDESMDRIDQNLAKGDKSRKAIDEWLNDQRSQ